MRLRNKLMILTPLAGLIGVLFRVVVGETQALPNPEVPVLSGPANGVVMSGANGWVTFSAVMNQPPPNGVVRQYTDYFEVCIARATDVCGAGMSEVCKFDTPLGKHGVRYLAVASIQIPPEFSGQMIFWTMRAGSKTNNNWSNWAPRQSLTYTWNPKPSTAPKRCRQVPGGGGNGGGGNGEPYTFGWETPITQREKNDFQLPDQCAVGKTLQQIVTQLGCSIRSDNQACVSCHNTGTATANVRLDNLMGKQDFINRNYLMRFLSSNNTKPQNLKNFFQDWQNRGFPD
ncbi:MAG: hypothetical protein ACREOI_26855 [bacterium]